MVLIVAIVFSSCERELKLESKNLEHSTINSRNLRVNGKYLEFGTEQEFQKYLTDVKVKKLSPNKLIEEVKKSGLNSLSEYYLNFSEKMYEDLITSNQISEKSNNNFLVRERFGEPTVVYAVEDYVLASTLNLNREVKIGNEIHQYFYDKVDIFDLKGIKIKSKKLIKYNSGEKPKDKGARIFAGLTSQSYEHDNRDYRICLESCYFGWKSNHGYSGSEGIISKHQKRFLGIWFNNEAPSLGLYGGAQAGTYLYDDICGDNWSSTYINSGGANCSYVQECFTGDVAPCYQSIFIETYVLCEDNQWRFLSLNDY